MNLGGSFRLIDDASDCSATQVALGMTSATAISTMPFA
jgi:geranylgeranyl pyrophosphate synthase